MTNLEQRTNPIDLSHTLRPFSVPVDATAELKIGLHLPDTTYLTYYLTTGEPGKRSLSPIGRRLVASNWEHFRDMNGWLKDDWEILKRDPDSINERIGLLNLQKERYFDLLQDHVKNNPDETEFVGRMKRSFETRIRNMEMTAFRAEMEAGNSPWSGHLGLVIDKLFQNTDTNKAAFGAVSHIVSKRRAIKREVDAIIEQDESLRKLTQVQYKLVLSSIERRFAQRVTTNLKSLSHADIEDRGITGLIETIEKGQDEQISFSEFVKESFPDYVRSDSDIDTGSITEKVVEAVEKERMTQAITDLGRKALAVTAIAAIGTSLLAGDRANIPITDSQAASEQGPAVVETISNGGEDVLPAAVSFTTPMNNVDTHAQFPPLRQAPSISDMTDSYVGDLEQIPELTTISTNEDVRNAVDSTGPEEEVETQWYELEGLDFSQPVTITLSPELSQAVGAGSESLVIDVENHTYDGLDGRENDPDSPDFTGEEASKRGLVVFGNYSENIFWKGHSYTEEVWKSKNVENWAFEFLRRLAVIKDQNAGELPENLKDISIKLSQGDITRTARLLNLTVLPEESFTIGVYDDGKPARYMIAEGDNVIDFGEKFEDLNEPGIVHMVTCINPIYDIWGNPVGFRDRVIASFQIEESKPSDSNPSVSNLDGDQPQTAPAPESEEHDATLPVFASIGTENLVIQDLRNVPVIWEKVMSPASLIVLQNIFTKYQPAAEALRQSDTPDDLLYFVGVTPTVSGSSVDRHLLFDRGDSLGSTPIQIIDGVPHPTHVAYQVGRAPEISPLLPAEETFQRFQIYETVTNNWSTWQTLGYTAESWAQSFNNSEARTMELFQVLWLQENGLDANTYPEVYTFSVNGITYSTALEAGNALADFLNNHNILDRQVTVDDIRNMVNRGTFNEIMLAFHQKTGRNLLSFIGMSRESRSDEDGDDPYNEGSLDVNIPSNRLFQPSVN